MAGRHGVPMGADRKIFPDKLMFKDTIVTVWSAPNYCYRCGNVAAILEFDENLKTNYKIFEAAPQDARGLPAKKAAPDYFFNLACSFPPVAPYSRTQANLRKAGRFQIPVRKINFLLYRSATVLSAIPAHALLTFSHEPEILDDTELAVFEWLAAGPTGRDETQRTAPHEAALRQYRNAML
ncbi:hypothetical protein BC830DRAFT_1085721 [Chytriomyces sp. MP71]|nr:hypothetical protein BC830DRAFT_1085721 [Chytriomyces sp. MP71]